MRAPNLNQTSIISLAVIGFIGMIAAANFFNGGGWRLLSTSQDTGTTSSVSGLELITANGGAEELAMLRGCSADEILKRQNNGNWACSSDATTSVTGAGADVLDLGDDDVNESDDFNELATTGDTNSVFTEPSADKLLVDLTQNWPTADAAAALSADPTDCTASNFANAIDTGANLTCAQVDFSDLTGSATDAQVPDTITIDNAGTADALTANGGNCAAGQGAGGVDASGAAEDCTDYADTSGDTFTGDVTFSGADLNIGLDCSGFSNGGTLSTTGSGVVHCQNDDSGAGGSAIILDTGDDGTNESTDLQEIATSGDTNSIFTEPSADKLLIDAANNWPTSDFADSFSANGANCSAGQYARGVDAAGVAEGCTADDDQPDSDAEVPDAITVDNSATGSIRLEQGTAPGNTTEGRIQWDTDDDRIVVGDGSTTATFHSGAHTTDTGPSPDCSGTSTYQDGEGGCDTLDGLEDLEAATDDGLALGNGSTFDTAVLPDCDDSGGNHLNYDTTGNSFACGTSGDGVGYDTVQNDGSGLTQRATLNMTGSGVTCSDTGSITECDIPGGGSTNSFETISAPNGTDPVADASNDTLNITEGSGLDITGTAGTDTILWEFNAGELGNLTWGTGSGFTWTFDASAGTDGQISFDDGLFSFIGNLLFDNEGEARWGENDANGSNYIAVKAPAAVTSNQTCTLDDDSTPFDPCVTANPSDLDSLETPTDDTALVGNGSTWENKTVPDCTDSGGNHLNYTQSTNTISCGTSGDGQGATESFTTINAPSGTDPVADSASDTLNYTSGQSTVAITGTASTDTIDFDAIGVNCTGCIGTTEVAGLDISDDTNLTCGRSLTTSGDGCDADAELFTVKKTINIINPTTSETNLAQYEYGTAATITEVSCSTNTGTVTIQLDERARATPNSAGTDVMNSTLVCDTDSQTSSSFANAGIAADVPVNLQITATSGTPGVVRIHVKATLDD